MGLSDILLPDDERAPDFGSIARGSPAFSDTMGAGDALPLIERYESGGRNILQQVTDPKISSASGYYQITNTTWRDIAPKTGIDTSQYPTAMSAPRDVQAKAASELYNERGFEPWSLNKALMNNVSKANNSKPHSLLDGLSLALDAYEANEKKQEEKTQQERTAQPQLNNSPTEDTALPSGDLSKYQLPVKRFIPPTDVTKPPTEADSKQVAVVAEYRQALARGVAENSYAETHKMPYQVRDQDESAEGAQQTAALESDLLRGQAMDDLKRGNILKGALGLFDASVAQKKSEGIIGQAEGGFITGLAKSIPLVREGMQYEGDVFGQGIPSKEKQEQSRNVLTQDAQKETTAGAVGSEVGSLVGTLAQLALVGQAHPELSPGGVFAIPSVPGRIAQSAERIKEGENPINVIANEAISTGIQYAMGNLLGPAAETGASVFREQASRRVGAALAQAGVFATGTALDEAIQSGKIDPMEVGKQAAMGAIFGMAHTPEVPESALRKAVWESRIPDAVMESHPVPVTDEILASLKESGAVAPDATAESLSPEMLAGVRRGEIAARVIDNLKTSGGDISKAITDTGKSFGMDEEKATALLTHPDIAQFIPEESHGQITEPVAEATPIADGESQRLEVEAGNKEVQVSPVAEVTPDEENTVAKTEPAKTQEEVPLKPGLEFKSKLRTAKEIEAWKEAHPDFPIDDGSSPKAIRDYAIQHRIPVGDGKGNKLGLGTIVDNIRNAVDLSETEARQAQPAPLITGNEDTLSSPAVSSPPSELSTSGTLQSVAIPGLQPFLEQDVFPTLGGVKATIKKFAALVAPRSGVEPKQLDSMMRLKGERDLEAAKLSKVGNMISHFFTQMPESEHIAFLDRYKTGQEQPNSELKFVADFIRKIDAQDFEQIKQYKPNISWRDNHLRSIWKVIPGREEENLQQYVGKTSKRPLEGSKGFLKQATLADVSEGLKRGGELVTTNPWDLFMRGHEDVVKFVTAQKMIGEAKQLGNLKFYRSIRDVPEGFAPIDDKVAKVYFKDAAGNVVKGGEWYGEEGFARALNNMLSTDAIRQGKFGELGQGLFWIKNHYTGFELAASPFHAVFETVEAMIQRQASGLTRMVNLGLRQTSPYEFLKGAGEFASFPLAPIKLAHEGAMLKNYIEQRYMTPEAREFKRLQNEKEMTGIRQIKNFTDARKYLGVEKFENKYVKDHIDSFLSDVFSGGIDLVGKDYSAQGRAGLRQAVSDGNIPGAMMRLLPAINQTIMEPLFKEYIPRLKLGGMLKAYSQSLQDYVQELADGTVTPEQLARKAWDQMENSFGEMNFDNLFWNKTFKSSLQLLFRSVTWKGGTLRQIFSGLHGQGKEFFDAIAGLKPGNEAYIPRLDPRFAWLASMSFTTALMGAVTQKALNGNYPWETDTPFMDSIYPRIDKNGHRFNPFTYARDIIGLAKNPFKYAEHSTTGILGRFMESLNNKDYYDTQVYNPDADIMTKGWDFISHMAPTPIGLLNINRAAKEDVSPGAKILTGLGFSFAPGYIERSEFENWAKDLSDRKRGIATPEERTEQQQKFEVRKALSKSSQYGDEGYKKAKGIAKEHNIAPATFARYVSEGNLEKEDRLTASMSARELSSGLEKASPEEKTKLLPILEDKINNSKTLSDSDKEQMRSQYGFEKPELTSRQKINQRKKEHYGGRHGAEDAYDKEVLWKQRNE